MMPDLGGVEGGIMNRKRFIGNRQRNANRNCVAFDFAAGGLVVGSAVRLLLCCGLLGTLAQ
jgi:hypothetical protein